VPVGQVAALDATLDQTLVRTLGALPLLLPLCDQLGLRAVVNRRCYPDGGAPEDIDLGRVALVLVLNRLLAPQPLVHVERWLAGTVLPDLLGLTAAQCNDDRLGRALDALLPHLNALWQDFIVAALTRFDLDLRALCYDLTSLSFCGAYAEADLIRYGYSRDHRPDQKQGGVGYDSHGSGRGVAGLADPGRQLGRPHDASGEPTSAAWAAGAPAVARPDAARAGGGKRSGHAQDGGVRCLRGGRPASARTARPKLGRRCGARPARRRPRCGVSRGPAGLPPPAGGA